MTPLAHTFDGHLWGSAPIGIYPINSDNNVYWGCVDIDFEDPDLAFDVRNSITRELDQWAFVERSRSKGYHVWVFFSHAVPAGHVRAGLLHACEASGYAPREVNPKQVALAPGSYGNFVRLPYPDIRKPDRQVVITPRGSELSLEDFVVGATACAAAPNSRWAELAAEVPSVRPKSDTIASIPVVDPATLRALVDRLPKGIRMIVLDGPRPGHDRSNSLVRLAHRMAESGLDVATAALALTIADSRWGKFSTRADGEQRLLEILGLAYGEELS
jgi:hypothetical protein